MQGYKVKEKTAIVPHCTPSFKTQWAPCPLFNRTEHSDIGINTRYIQSVNSLYNILSRSNYTRGHHVRDHMPVTTDVVVSTPAQGMVCRFNVITFVSDLQQVGGFLLALRFPPSIKLTVMI
jgi:hypothetical protein